MAFVWIPFLDSRRIPYATSGKNVSSGNLVVRCPFCGSADPSMHMSVAIDGSGWRCLRRPDAHRGISPVKLVAALVGCSFEQAKNITGVRTQVPEDFMGRINQLLVKTPREADTRLLKLPKEVYPITDKILARPYINHLRVERQIADEDIWQLTERFGVGYCRMGPYAGRIVFPVVHEGRLVTWTARTISRNVDLRYKVLSTDPEKARKEGLPPALMKITDCLLWYDELLESEAHTIHICEGPFDALKVRLLGEPHGITGTCLFTSTATEAQIDLLHELLPRFKHRFLLLDEFTLQSSIPLQGKLSSLGVRPKHLPSGVKDPDKLTDWRALTA